MSFHPNLPAKPPRELLVSMAMRLDHAFGVDRHEAFPGCWVGYTPEERAIKLLDMERLYEEVAGLGFYRWGVPSNPLYAEVKVASRPGEETAT